MKRINSLLSVDKIGSNMYKGVIRNGSKKGEVVIPKIASYSELTFTNFFKYCMEQYEIYICSERNKEYFFNLFKDNQNVSKEDLETFFGQAEIISLKLEEVYGNNIKYFISNLSSESLRICGKEFKNIKEKTSYLMENVK